MTTEHAHAQHRQRSGLQRHAGEGLTRSAFTSNFVIAGFLTGGNFMMMRLMLVSAAFLSLGACADTQPRAGEPDTPDQSTMTVNQEARVVLTGTPNNLRSFAADNADFTPRPTFAETIDNQEGVSSMAVSFPEGASGDDLVGFLKSRVGRQPVLRVESGADDKPEPLSHRTHARA